MTDFSSEPISTLALSPTATHLAAAAGQNNLALVSLPPISTTPLPLSRAPSLHPAPSLTSLSFPSSSSLYLCDARGSFKRFAVSQTLTHSYTVSAAHGGEELTAIAALSASSSIVTSGKDGLVRVWDAETRQSVARLAGHRYEVRDVALAASTDADVPVTLIASAGRDRTVRLWDVRAAASKELCVFKGHSGWVHSVAMACAGVPIIVSCGGDKTVRVWDLVAMKERAVMRGHEYRVWDLAVAADASFAVSGSTDATVRAWNLAGGEEQCHVFEGHRDTVLAVDAAKDGSFAVSGCEDGAIYMWDCSTLFGREAKREGILVDVGGDIQSPVGQQPPNSLDTEPLIAEKPPIEPDTMPIVKVTPHTPKTESKVDAEKLKAAVAVSANQMPKYDKSAAELVNALKRIQELEKLITGANARLASSDEEIKQLKSDVSKKDSEIAVLKKQVDASQNLVNAANVRALLATNPRKADTALDYEEPVNKIGAVSDQLTALAARLDAMIATN